MLQNCSSSSTADVELNTAVKASKEVVHLLANALKEMGIDVEQTLQLFVDNQACIALSNTSKTLGQTEDLVETDN